MGERVPANKTSTKGRVTQSTVAREAGVSTAVVSAVLNPNANSPIRVGQETADRVRAVVKELGYTPNPIAQSLAKGRRNILGVFTYEPTFPSDKGNFFYPMLHGIEREMSHVGRDLLLFTSVQIPGQPRSIFDGGMNRLALSDGAILLGQEPNADELIRLTSEAFPFVTIGRRKPGAIEVNWVGAGYADATERLVEMGYKLGHVKMGLVSSAVIREQQSDRIAGFLAGTDRFGLQVPDHWRLNVAPDAIDPAWIAALLDAGVTLLLAETFDHALAVERIFGARGGRVPDDLSVAVLGTPMDAGLAVEKWTRLRIPREEMGREAVKTLVGLLDGTLTAPVQITLPCEVIAGTTLTKLTQD